jgi:mannitol-1-phosphate 5-dehydrogenase
MSRTVERPVPSERPTAVVFGAGKMACGLIGHVLSNSGFNIHFVARRPEVVRAINRHAGYQLNIAGRARPEIIRGCSALLLRDRARVTEAVARADLVFTAVGIDHLSAVTPVIGAGLFMRSKLGGGKPLNVIACENLPGAGAYLGHQIVGSASPETALCIERIGGFSAAITLRVMTGGGSVDGELHFNVDSEHGLVIDQVGLKGALPRLDGAVVSDKFTAMIMRKFFTVNCAQAVAAYLGYREGCEYIHEAVAHPRVAPLVAAAVAEATAGLMAEFPAQAAAIEHDAAEALDRLRAAEPRDEILRVAREPRRKLSPRERLIGPARLAERHGLPTQALSQAIAAALAYDAPGDPQAVALQQTIAAESLEQVLTEDCGLLPHEPLARSVKRDWQRLLSARTSMDGHTSAARLPRPGALLQDAISAMLSELSRHYEPDLIRDALARAVEGEFGRTQRAAA